jgi:hypothetical protein
MEGLEPRSCKVQQEKKGTFMLKLFYILIDPRSEGEKISFLLFSLLRLQMERGDIGVTTRSKSPYISPVWSLPAEEDKP